MSKGPRFIRYMVPLLEVLQDMGGSASSYEATDSVIERVKIPEAELSKTNQNGQSTVRNQIAWARMYLVHSGHIDSSTRGVWTLTGKGMSADLSRLDPLELFRSIHAVFQGDRRTKPTTADPKPDKPEAVELDETSTNLIPVLKSLSPAGFERLCQRLLREYGFQNVKVTGRSGDGGIDGEGILEINPLLSFKVIFQCKRYEASVTSSMVRDFRGAMIGRADKGIFLTTSTFTMDARKEAVRDGAGPIELVDGDKLVLMFEKLQLGLKPKTIYEIDQAFFQEFR